MDRPPFAFGNWRSGLGCRNCPNCRRGSQPDPHFFFSALLRGASVPGVSAASLGPAPALGSCHAGGRRHHRSAGNQRAVSVGARPARTGHLLAATGVPGMATRWGIPVSRKFFFPGVLLRFTLKTGSHKLAFAAKFKFLVVRGRGKSSPLASLSFHAGPVLSLDWRNGQICRDPPQEDRGAQIFLLRGPGTLPTVFKESRWFPWSFLQTALGTGWEVVPADQIEHAGRLDGS